MAPRGGRVHVPPEPSENLSAGTAREDGRRAGRPDRERGTAAVRSTRSPCRQPAMADLPGLGQKDRRAGIDYLHPTAAGPRTGAGTSVIAGANGRVGLSALRAATGARATRCGAGRHSRPARHAAVGPPRLVAEPKSHPVMPELTCQTIQARRPVRDAAVPPDLAARPALRDRHDDPLLVNVKPDIRDTIPHDPSPMHEAQHRPIRRNPRYLHTCETGRPALRRTCCLERFSQPQGLADERFHRPSVPRNYPLHDFRKLLEKQIIEENDTENGIVHEKSTQHIDLIPRPSKL